MSVTAPEAPPTDVSPRIQGLLNRGWRLTGGPAGTWQLTHPVHAGFIALDGQTTRAA
jgi:hypothetical protein